MTDNQWTNQLITIHQEKDNTYSIQHHQLFYTLEEIGKIQELIAFFYQDMDLIEKLG